MTTAPTVAICVTDAGLTIALVVSAVDLATVLTSVGWHLVGTRVNGDVKSVSAAVVLLVRVEAVINERSESPRAEVSLNERVALKAAVLGHLTAALARAVLVDLTGHAFTPVSGTVGTAGMTSLDDRR